MYFAASSAAEPASRAAAATYESANGQTTVTSHDSGFPVSLYDIQTTSEYAVGPHQLIKHKGHVVCYDRRRRIAFWVAEHLTKDNLKGDADRKNARYMGDPKVLRKFSASDTDYSYLSLIHI